MTRKRLSIPAILDATLEIGLDVATTSTVARRLGVEQPALYRHVASKAALLDLAAAQALGGLAEWRGDPSPQRIVAGFQRALWSSLDGHRGLARYLTTTSEIPSPLQRAAERLVDALQRTTSLSAREAVLIVDAVVHLTCLTHSGAERLGDEEASGRWRNRRGEIASAPIGEAVTGIEQTAPLDLALEQVALLLRGVSFGDVASKPARGGDA